MCISCAIRLWDRLDPTLRGRRLTGSVESSRTPRIGEINEGGREEGEGKEGG